MKVFSSYFLILFYLSNIKIYAQIKMIGVSAADGGYIYAIDQDGQNPEIWQDFRYEGVFNPSTELTYYNSRLYGMTSKGSGHSFGAIFYYEPNTNNMVVIHEFDGINGSDPIGALLEYNGQFYGATWRGGSYGRGTIFRIDPDGENFEVVHEFLVEFGEGRFPLGKFLLYDNKIWGTTAYGGETGSGLSGIIFNIDLTDDSFNLFYNDYTSIRSGLIFYNNNFWFHDKVTLIGVSPETATINHVDYDMLDCEGDDATDCGEEWGACDPRHGLIEVDEYLWGVTINADPGGFVYNYNTFNNSKGLELSIPGTMAAGELIHFENQLIGLTNEGGTFNDGVIYSVDLNDNTINRLHSIAEIGGKRPIGKLLEYEGWLWGVCSGGGKANKGIIFKLNAVQNEISKVYDFGEDIGGVIQNNEPLLFEDQIIGSIALGGNYGLGFLYTMNNDGSNFNIIHHFNGEKGSGPNGKLLIAESKFYGTTTNGGLHDSGIIFSVNRDGTEFNSIYNFEWVDGDDYCKDGPFRKRVVNNLIEIEEKLYGTFHLNGGRYSNIFSINKNGSDYSPAFDPQFNDLNGEYRASRIVPYSLTHSQGKLWGTIVTYEDGTLLFTWDLDSLKLNEEHKFTESTGQDPVGHLIENNDRLWGVTKSGGNNSLGVIYSIGIDSSDYKVEHHFNQTNGGVPTHGLTISNYKFWGKTSTVGLHNRGTIFSIDFDGTNFTKISDLTDDFGGATSVPLVASNKSTQKIVFEPFPDTLTINSPDFNINAYSTSGLSLTFQINNDAIATVDDQQVVAIISAGETEVMAYQEGDENYFPTEGVSQVLVISSILDAIDHGKLNPKSIYPNPAREFFSINIDEKNVKWVILTDLQGNVIKDYRNILNNSFSLDGISNGTYLVLIQTFENSWDIQKLSVGN